MRMRYILSLALVVVVQVGLQAQSAGTYRVVRVVGHVESGTLKRELKPADVIPERDQLKFKSAKDYLIIFNPEKGRKQIKGVPDEKPRELDELLGSFLKPDEKSTGTRGTNQAYLEMLKSSLQDTVLILGDGTIELDPQQISLNPPATIKAEYKPERKKGNVVVVVSKGKFLHLDKKTLFPSNPEVIPEVLLLYFLEDSSNPLEAEDFLGHFVPLYADESALLIEVMAIVESLKGSGAEELEKQVSAYLQNEYAKPQPQNMRAWLKTNKLLPAQ